MQGSPASHAPTEPPPGPVFAVAGAYDESSGEDDSDSPSIISLMGSQRGQGPREVIRCGKDVTSLITFEAKPSIFILHLTSNMLKV